MTIAVGVEAADLKPVDATVGVMNLCRALTAAVADGVPALTAEVPGTDVLAGINLCAAVVTEPGAAGRIPREGIEGRGALDDRGIRACAEVPTTLDVLILAPVEVEATGDAVVLGRRDSGDASLCPDAAVTLGLLALMPVGVEALGPAAANVAGVLDLGVPNGAANLCADVLATAGVVGLGAVVLGPVAGLLVLGQVVEVAVLGPVLGVPVLGQVVELAVLGPVAGVPVRGAVVAVKVLGPDDGVLALGPVAGVLLPVPAGENGYLDPVITELDVVVPWP